jgi:hypothetical protein
MLWLCPFRHQSLFAPTYPDLHRRQLTKVRAQAQAKTFCREDRIQQHLDAARQHIEAMGDPEQETASDPCAQAKLRAARERVEKLDRALEEIEKLRMAKMEDKRG